MDKLEATAVAQIGIIVSDIDKAAKAWAETLGIPVPAVVIMANDEHARTEYRGKPSRAMAKGVFFQIGQVQIELIQPVGEPSTWNDFLRDHGEGIHHIAFWMKDLKMMVDAKAMLSAKGMPPVQQGGWKGGEYAYIDSVKRLGATLELLSPDK